MRFGVMTLLDVSWEELARRFEQADELAGLASAWTCDHLVWPLRPEAPWLEGWATLAALADRTSRVRVGPLVLSMTFHNVAAVAKQAIAIDHISGGRLELGIGGGGSPTDHEVAGVPNLTPKERAARFSQWARRLDELVRGFEPPSVQRPRPPITIAGSGPTYLRLAAELGDRWNTYGRRGLTAEDGVREAREQNARLDELCHQRGRDPATLVRSQLLGLRFFLDEAPFDSTDAFHDVAGRYGAAGMTELIFYWPRDHERAVFEAVLGDAAPSSR